MSTQNCESWALEISALVDGELEAEAILEVVDHLTRCAACREFYRQARVLAQGVVTVDPRRHAPAPELWTAIAKASSTTVPVAQQTVGPRRPTLVALAAAAVLAIGAYFLLKPVSPAPSAPVAVATQMPREIVLGGGAEAMTDQRFVELTTELLEADPRYRRELRSILQQVAVNAPAAEDGSVDSSWPDETTVFSEVFRSGSSSGEWRSATF